ncbi:CPBP family intramembrane metalloprotease [Fulvivirga sp. 29W222]|uniref:CPBP family intramembrane metalloprotease n=1 Tax=Fulvivirga marina TaxID=2494733 RepID=A0A937G358_9BACT|nr:CPBP family intramembrane glutamic endopeptidase [Fulvivirga marina]MBL6449832.1 CPBP family intramembrane metalloprotease [Fulvivirga marina]
MSKFDNNIHLSEGRSSAASVIFIFGLSLLGALIGSQIGIFLAIPFYPGSMMEMLQALANPTGDSSLRIPLYISQGFGTLLGMIVIPFLYLRVRENKDLSIFFSKPIGWLPIALTFGVVMTFMIVNSIFIEWNANIHFPEFMKGFEQWARAKEDTLAEITLFITKFERPLDFAMAFFVIAILAPLGEELLFRGFIQNELHTATKNIHIAIWVSAILFSTIHMQFFGFIPRLLLGALFGYLYYWAGNLWIPITAHFVNNGFTVVVLYLHQQGIVSFDIENTESVPLSTALIFAIITVGLLYYFRSYFFRRTV